MIKNDNIKELLNNTYIVPESIFDGRYTKTSLFMLPSLDISLSSINIKPFLINAFLDDREYNHIFIRPIFVLFKTKSYKDITWKKLYESLMKKPEYLVDYDCGIQNDFNLVMFVFACPEKYKEDYYHFKRGRYSKFSEEYKKKFPEAVTNDKGKFVKSLMYGVIHKTNYIKSEVERVLMLDPNIIDEMDELWEIPLRHREYYRYKNDENELRSDKET